MSTRRRRAEQVWAKAQKSILVVRMHCRRTVSSQAACGLRPTPLPPTLRHAVVDGIVLAGEYPLEIIERVARELNRPIVLVDHLIPGMLYDAVNADDFGGGYLAAQHLLSLGWSQLRVLVDHPLVPSLCEREPGFRAACATAGVAPGPSLYTSPTWDSQVIRREIAAQLRALPLPHALFCAVDSYAITALELCRTAEIVVPGQMSLIGFDDLESTPLRYPNLATLM